MHVTRLPLHTMGHLAAILLLVVLVGAPFRLGALLVLIVADKRHLQLAHDCESHADKYVYRLVFLASYFRGLFLPLVSSQEQLLTGTRDVQIQLLVTPAPTSTSALLTLLPKPSLA